MQVSFPINATSIEFDLKFSFSNPSKINGYDFKILDIKDKI